MKPAGAARLVACVLAGGLASGCVSYGGPIQPREDEPASSTGLGDLGTYQPEVLPLETESPVDPAGMSPVQASPAEAPPAEAALAPAAEAPAQAPATAEGEMPASEPVPEPGPPVLPGSAPPVLPLLGTAERPELDPAVAERMSVADYLALAGDLSVGLTRDGWDPSAGAGDVAGFVADFRVAVSGGTHTTLAAAVSDVVAAGGTARRFIELEPGTYREVVCVPSGSPPLTIYGIDADATQTVVAFDNYSGKPKAAGTAANPCNPNTAGTTFGTSGSATFAVFGADFVAKNLSIVNDTDEAQASGNLQAVALLLQGDRALFDNVRVLGNQDTLLAKTPNVDRVARSYFKGSYVEGDTDVILGRGTLVFDGGTIHLLSARLQGGTLLSPSTDARNPFGFLISGASFEADASANAGGTRLGRAWDESQNDLATYAAAVATGTYPNGQALVRGSSLGAHIDTQNPWRDSSSTNRPFAASAGDYPANRLFEFGNAPAPATTP